MSQCANEVRGENLTNNLKTENKWKFLLTGENFHKHQNILMNRNMVRKNKTRKGKKKREGGIRKRKRTQKGGREWAFNLSFIRKR